jgi:hypothetical protein
VFGDNMSSDYTTKITQIVVKLQELAKDKYKFEGRIDGKSNYVVERWEPSNKDASKKVLCTILMTHARGAFSNGDVVEGEYNKNTSDVYFSLEDEDIKALVLLVQYLFPSDKNFDLANKSPFIVGRNSAPTPANGAAATDGVATERMNNLQAEVDRLTLANGELAASNNRMVAWGRQLRELTQPINTPFDILTERQQQQQRQHQR